MKAHDRPAARPLTARQRAFVGEYLASGNATQAALGAGYSPRTAASQGQRLLRNVEIAGEIEAAQAVRAIRLELSRDAAIEQLRRLAFSDPRKMFDARGFPKPITELDDETVAALTAYEVEMRHVDGPDAPPVAVLKVRFADRRAALDAILKAQGWNAPDRREVSGPGGGPIPAGAAVRIILVPLRQSTEAVTEPMVKAT